MINDTEKLIIKINDLIEVLRKTNNPTINFYNMIITAIRNCNSEEELEKVLDKHLIHSGAITDYGGYNREQCNSFDEMWKVAKSICTKNEKSTTN